MQDKPRRGVATIDDLRARSIIAPATRCWLWQGATIGGAARIWTLHLDRMDKGVLSGPRAVWYIAHGTPLHSRIAYMACWTKGCVCPVHVRAAENKTVLNRVAAQAGVFIKSPAARKSNEANLLKARQARGVADTPPETVLAIRAAAGKALQKNIAAEFGLTKTMVSRIIRGETYRHLLPVGTGKAWAPSMGAGSVFAWRPAA